MTHTILAKRTGLAGWLGAGLSVLLAPMAAHAQTATAAAGLEEIVVTAERREQRLQDVPISVTALSTAQLEAKQVVDVTSLSKLVPGMSSKATLTPIEITIAIRGVTQLNTQVTFDPPIGSYVDGVYTMINPGTNTAMIDMERVEVLKGPQGTLFGRNTVGGAISITTKAPTDKFEGYGQVDLGNHDARMLTAVVNAPISPGKLDTRFVYQYSEHGGYGTNITLNKPVSTLVQNYFRGSVRARPSDDWEIMLSGYHVRSAGNNTGTHSSYVDPNARLNPALPNNAFFPVLGGRPGDLLTNYVNLPGYWDAATNQLDKFKLNKFGFTGTVTGKLGDAVTIKSITGYTRTKFNTVSDIDGQPFNILNVWHFPLQSKEFSEELQIYGDAMDGRLQWIAGGYYFHMTGSKQSFTQSLGILQPANAQLFNPTGPFATNNSYAGFVQATYAITPEIRVTGGIRYTHDTRKAIWHDHSEIVTLPPPGAFVRCLMALPTFPTTPQAACNLERNQSYNFVPWTAGIDFKPNDDTMLYAKISKGYRSGAFSSSAPVGTTLPSGQPNVPQNAFLLANFVAVAPENLLSPEIGAKVDLLDRRLRINVAAFYSDYKNIQINTNFPADPNCPTCAPVNILQNTGQAHIYGGELEVAALLGKLRLDAALGVSDPKYVKGPYVGVDLINVSKVNYTLGAAYPFETSYGSVTPSLTYSWRSKQTYFTGAPNAGYLAGVSQKGYGTLDGRVSFELESVPVTMSLYGANLTNTKYAVSGTLFAPPLGLAVNWPGAPRTFGGSVRYTF